MSETTIAVLTDIHLEPEHEAELFEALDSTLDRIQSRAPDQLVVLGDLVQDTNTATDEQLLTAFVNRLDATDIPYRCLAGNHDVQELSSETYESITGTERYGISDDTVFLDSAAPHLSHGRGEVSEAQLELLTKRLPALTAPLVFVHHPIHYHDIHDNRWFGQSPEAAFCGNKEAVLDILQECSTEIPAVINGHLHEWSHTEYRNIDHFTIDSFNKILEPDCETGTYAMLERGDDLCVTQYDGDGYERSVHVPLA